MSRSRCYDCFRPAQACYCDEIPGIDNRTAVLILQHRREQFHRFNTARIVHKALRNSRLIADHTENLGRRLPSEFPPRTGLLYPGPQATLVSDLPIEQRPDQLIVVDGTWHQAKTLVRDLAVLQGLPRYQLLPTAPSRYRIRREPNAMALSTIEAAVAALQILEPETKGFEQLLNTFETMIEAQLAHSGSASSSRFKARRCRSVMNIPRALHGNLKNIVVAYGEAAAGQRGHKREAGGPITWVAQRLGDGETFACTLIPPHPLSDEFLAHLGLSQGDFAAAISLEEARRQWSRFERPGDVMVVFHSNTARLFSYVAGHPRRYLVLKSIDVPSIPAQVMFTTDSAGSCAQSLGRSTRRLAETIAIARYLNGMTQ